MGHIVLFSSGWESTYCALKSPPDSRLMFCDYGQPYAEQELACAGRVAYALKRNLSVVRMNCIPSRNGVFQDRNQRLLELAATRSRTVWFGCRMPWAWMDYKYKDSNREFVDYMEQQLQIYIETPALMLPKWYIKRKVLQHLQDSLIFSSEGLS